MLAIVAPPILKLKKSGRSKQAADGVPPDPEQPRPA